MSQTITLDDVIAKAVEVPAGEPFTIRQLFGEAHWEAQPKRTRLSLGRSFKEAVDAKGVPGVSFVERRSDNSSLYVRVG